MVVTDVRERFQPRKFGDQAAEVIRQMILTGELRCGERLNEVALAQELGISRSPIREALNALAGEGLINFTPGRGAFVPEIDLDTVRQLGQARRALECEAVRLVVENATDGALDELYALVERVATDGEAGLYPPGVDFHSLIVSYSGNKVIEQLAATVHRQLRVARLVSEQTAHRTQQAFDEHLKIVDAVRRRDTTEAVAAMYEHLTRASITAERAMSLVSAPVRVS